MKSVVSNNGSKVLVNIVSYKCTVDTKQTSSSTQIVAVRGFVLKFEETLEEAPDSRAAAKGRVEFSGS